MAIYSLKRSYQLKDLREVDFKDLWGDHGIFTTMWIFGKPVKILFFKNHIKNLIKLFGPIGASAGSLFVFKGKLKAVLINYPNKEIKDEICVIKG